MFNVFYNGKIKAFKTLTGAMRHFNGNQSATLLTDYQGKVIASR